MEAKARSVSVMWRKEKESNTADTEWGREAAENREKLEDFFLVAEVSEGADVGDDEGHAQLIVRAHLAQSDAAIFEGDAAAFAIVADLRELVLQGAVGDVVADSGGDVEAAARFAAVA